MLAVIRIRGTVEINPKNGKTLELLMLHKPNHLVLVPDSKEMSGMVRKVKDYVTFGEISGDACAVLLEKRGRLLGNKRIDKAFLQKNKFENFAALAKAVIESSKKLKELGIKPVFRLSPPSKGFERAGIKKSFHIGGALGYRKGNINELLEKMV